MLFRNGSLSMLLIFTFIFARAQNCDQVFSGTILDNNYKTLAGVAILLKPGNVGAATDVNGNFHFAGLCPKKQYHVRIQFLGYETQDFDFYLSGSIDTTIVISEQVTRLKEVVVHHDASHTEHASNYSVLNEKQLEAAAGKSLGEALQDVPGVTTLQSGPGIFKPVINGLHSNRILVLNYGIRQEGQQWGAEHAPEIDPFIASNIVVIKDASAIKYGTDALGGVIVVNPPDLPETPELNGTIQTVAQSNGRGGTISGMLEGGLGKHQGWGWRVQGTAKRLGDFQTPSYSLTNTGTREMNWSSSLGYHRESRGIDVFFSHFQSSIGILKGTAINSLEDLANAMSRDVPLSTSDFSYNISEPHQQVSHNLLKVNGHVRTHAGEWHWQYGFQSNNRKEFDLRMGALSEIPAIDLKLNTHTVETDWETLHSSKRSLSFGANGMFQENVNNPGTQRIPFIPNFASTSAGVFGLAKLFYKRMTLNLGSRYDIRSYDIKGYDFKNSEYHSSLQFHNVSASAGGTFFIDKSQTLDFNASTTWRPPHVAELYSVGTHQSAAAIEYGLMLNDSTNEVTDRDVKTEQAFKFVTTYKKTAGRFLFQLSPSANVIRNYVYLKPEGVTRTIRGVFPYFRYAQTDVLFLGADVSGETKIIESLSLGATASLLRVSDLKHDSYLVFIPSNRYELSFRYERNMSAKVKRLFAESRTKYVDRQRRAPRVISVQQIIQDDTDRPNQSLSEKSNFDFMAAPEGYWLWNLAAGFSVGGDHVQYDFRISCQNVLNQSYRDYTNRYRYYADDLGRNIMLSVKCIF